MLYIGDGPVQITADHIESLSTLTVCSTQTHYKRMISTRLQYGQTSASQVAQRNRHGQPLSFFEAKALHLLLPNERLSEAYKAEAGFMFTAFNRVQFLPMIAIPSRRSKATFILGKRQRAVKRRSRRMRCDFC